MSTINQYKKDLLIWGQLLRRKPSSFYLPFVIRLYRLRSIDLQGMCWLIVVLSFGGNANG